MSAIKPFQPIYQIRVIPKLSWPFSGYPVYYDSGTLFTSEKDAKDFIVQYIQGLVTSKILNPKKAYEVAILELKVYDPPSEGMLDLAQKGRQK